MNRFDIINPERTFLPLCLLIIDMTDSHLGPDTPEEEPIELSDILLRDMDIPMTEVYQFCPVFVIFRIIPHFDLIDDHVLASFPDKRLSLG